jgi:ribosomal protein L37AE/L43A
MTAREWRRVLRTAKAARGAGCLGPRIAARAAAAEAAGASQDTRLAAACVLAAQAAKNEFLTDLRTFWHQLEGADAFRRQMQQSAPSRTYRRAPQVRDRLPVDAAKAVPILELLQRYGHQLRRAGAEWTALCPFHDDTRPSLHVNASKGLWRCHACGAGGDGIAYVMQRKGLDFTAAVREIAA